MGTAIKVAATVVCAAVAAFATWLSCMTYCVNRDDGKSRKEAATEAVKSIKSSGSLVRDAFSFAKFIDKFFG